MIQKTAEEHTIAAVPAGAEDFNDFVTRDYRHGDFNEITFIWGKGNEIRGDDEDTVERSIDMGGKMLLLEQVSTGRICGTSWMTFDGRRIHLHHFNIHKDFQGKGLARILLKKSLEFVREKGYQVKLEVHRTNFRGIGLYKKAGFEYLGDFDVYIIRDLSVIDKYLQ